MTVQRLLQFPDAVRSKQRPAALRNLVLSLIGLVTMAAFIGILAARSYNGSAFRTHGRKQLALDHVFNGTFGVDRKSLNWVPEGFYLLMLFVFSPC